METIFDYGSSKYAYKGELNIMIKKIITAIAILLSIGQVGFVVYFLMMYTSDNVPLFMFLLAVPLVNLLALYLSKHQYWR